MNISIFIQNIILKYYIFIPKKPACTFYNDKGRDDKSSLNKGNVVDVSSTDTDKKLYYVLYN